MRMVTTQNFRAARSLYRSVKALLAIKHAPDLQATKYRGPHNGTL